MNNNLTRLNMTSNSSISVLNFVKEQQIPFVFCEVQRVLDKKTDKYIKKIKGNPKGWMKWDFEKCLIESKKYKKYTDNTCLNINLTNSKWMIIDIDTENKELLEKYLKEYGQEFKSKSCSRGLPHLWRLKDNEDKNTTKTSFKEGLDLIYTNIFEKITSSIQNYNSDNFKIFKDFPRLEKKLNKTKSNDSGFFDKSKIDNLKPENLTLETKKEVKLETIINLLNCIDNDLKNNIQYDDWFKIVMSCKDSNINSKNIVNNWCKKCPRHNQEEFEKVWNSSREQTNNDVTIGTLHYYANLYNSNKYQFTKLYTTYEPDEDNLSKLYLKLNGENIIYQNEKVYIYNNDLWLIDDHNFNRLKLSIRKTLIKYLDKKLSYYIKKNRELQSLFDSINEEERKDNLTEQSTNEEYLKGINKCLKIVKQSNKISSISKFVIQELTEFNFNVEFDLLEDQKFNLHFKNGVYEIDNKRFRNRVKDDYITKILNWDYSENVDNNCYNEVLSFFKKIQPDEEQRKFLLQWLGYCLTGDISRTKFKMNIGYMSSNGKSTEFEIHDKVFDIYSYKLSSNTFKKDNEKAHKQLIHLIQKPVRFCYIEELPQKELDAEFIKDFVDGKKLNVEIMYGTSQSHKIQAKLNTCSNKDFCIDTDKAILRRGIVQSYKSQFSEKATTDDFENHIYKRENNYTNLFYDEKMKNAYLKLLLDYYEFNFKVPKYNEQEFKSISEEYDEFSPILYKDYEISEDNKAFVSKSEIIELFDSKKYNWKIILGKMKSLGIRYDRLKMVNGERGYFIGLKKKDNEEEE